MWFLVAYEVGAQTNFSKVPTVNNKDIITEDTILQDVEYLYLGGTESNPLIIKKAQQYIFEDPYFNKSVTYVPQILINNIWLDFNYFCFENSISHGIALRTTSDGKILIGVGSYRIAGNSFTHDGVPDDYRSSSAISSVAFRVKVIK